MILYYNNYASSGIAISLSPGRREKQFKTVSSKTHMIMIEFMIHMKLLLDKWTEHLWRKVNIGSGNGLVYLWSQMAQLSHSEFSKNTGCFVVLIGPRPVRQIMEIWACCPTYIAGAIILVPCHVCRFLQLIWRSGSRRWNHWTAVPAMAIRWTEMRRWTLA